MPSVLDEIPYSEFVANGVSTVFGYTFTVLQAADLVVYDNGVVVPSSNYSVSGIGDEGGGAVTFLVAPLNTHLILLSRELALERDTDYQYNGPLREQVLDNDFNRLWQALQGQRAQIGGSIRFPYPEQATELPPAAQRAGFLLGFDVVTGAITMVTAAIGSALALALQYASSVGSSLIGFLQSGAGATARTVQDKNRDVFDARDFGALPGSSDASNKAALQLAITAAALYSATSGNTTRVVIRDSYGYKTTDKTTHPSFTGITVPLVVEDISAGDSYAGFPTAYDGAQERIFFHTPQTTSGLTFNAPLSIAATSGTLTSVWAGTTGTREVRFSNGNVRYALLTNGSAATTWSGGLSSAATASATYVVGNHDGNGQWIHGAWHPYICVNSTANVSGGTRTALDNYRASFFLGADGLTGGRFGQGTVFGEAFTKEELTNMVLEMFALPGDTIGTSWSPWIAVRKTQRVSYGIGTNGPLANHHFAPGNSADTTDVALFQSFGATSTISLQSTSGAAARSMFRNNAGVTEIGAQTGGASIKIRQADSFMELGTGSSYTYHHSVQASRSTNWVSFINNTNATDGFVQRLQSTSAQAATWSFIEGYANAGADLRVRIAGTGNITNVNNSYGAISDATLKREISDAASAWSDFSAYKFRKFKYAADPLGRFQLGVVAQEIELISPGLVEEIPEFREVTKQRTVTREHVSGLRDKADEFISVPYEETEEYIERETTGRSIKTVKYSILYMKACVALQEAMVRIEALEERLNKLEKAS
jgi:hypothetical protein